MPTILRAEGFEIKIYLNDHAPVHVHALKAGGEAIITLEPIILLRFWGMTRSDAARAKRIVRENQTFLLKNWNRIHGQ